VVRRDFGDSAVTSELATAS
jgi:hypothetical protein